VVRETLARASTSSYTMSLEALRLSTYRILFHLSRTEARSRRYMAFYRSGSLSRGSGIRSAICGGSASSLCLVVNDAIAGCALTVVPQQ
jgi:hypothetical protein